jgi:hypothetical protein
MPDFLDMIIFPIFKNKLNSLVLEGKLRLLSVGPFRLNGNIPSTVLMIVQENPGSMHENAQRHRQLSLIRSMAQKP